MLKNYMEERRKRKRAEEREATKRMLEARGFRVLDEEGWFDGVYCAHRYTLMRGEETINGHFFSLRDVVRAVNALRAQQKGLGGPATDLPNSG